MSSKKKTRTQARREKAWMRQQIPLEAVDGVVKKILLANDKSIDELVDDILSKSLELALTSNDVPLSNAHEWQGVVKAVFASRLRQMEHVPYPTVKAAIDVYGNFPLILRKMILEQRKTQQYENTRAATAARIERSLIEEAKRADRREQLQQRKHTRPRDVLLHETAPSDDVWRLSQYMRQLELDREYSTRRMELRLHHAAD